MTLEELRRTGSLTPREFEQAKAKLLSDSQNAPNRLLQPSAVSEQRLRRLEIENQLLRVEQNWYNERDRLMLRNKHGQEYVPTIVQAIVTGSTLAFFGILWAVLRPALFPFSFLMIILGVVIAWGIIRKANNYVVAESAYREEADRLNNELQQISFRPDQ